MSCSTRSGGQAKEAQFRIFRSHLASSLYVPYITYRGKFGKVLKCVHRDTGQTFAAKFVLCSAREDRRNVEREVTLKRLTSQQDDFLSFNDVFSA